MVTKAGFDSSGQPYPLYRKRLPWAAPKLFVGFGVSQVLPVGRDSSFLRRQAHLHPKVQSELADLLIEVVKNRKLQIILESHSDYPLLQVAFTSEIEKLDVDAYGNITNWPQNFFGDEMGDLAAKAKAEMKRRKADKS